MFFEFTIKKKDGSKPGALHCVSGDTDSGPQSTQGLNTLVPGDSKWGLTVEIMKKKII